MRSRASSFNWWYPLMSLRSTYDISVLGKRLSTKSDNVVVFPFAFHIAVQQPFKPLWSHLVLYKLKPSQASFVLCFKSLLMTLLPASVLVFLFVWHLPFDLSSKGIFYYMYNKQTNAHLIDSCYYTVLHLLLLHISMPTCHPQGALTHLLSYVNVFMKS